MDIKRCLITGGAGFIGSHLVKSLLADSVTVMVVDRRKLETSPILRNDPETSRLDFLELDLGDYGVVKDLVSSFKPDVVYHLAAQPLSAVSNIFPLRTAEDNIMTTYSVLEAVRGHKSKIRLVYASTACFYGVPVVAPPLAEGDPPAIGNYVYTATKIAADYAVQHYRYIYGLDAICARMVNVYGPGDVHVERVVPRMILSAMNNEEPTLSQSDGSDVLSFLFVSDAVAALRLLGEGPRATENAVWNIPGSEPISVLDLMKKVYAVFGFPRQTFAEVGPRRNLPVHKYLDGTLIREVLGFAPRVALDSGLSLTTEWYSNFFSAADPRAVDVRV